MNRNDGLKRFGYMQEAVEIIKRPIVDNIMLFVYSGWNVNPRSQVICDCIQDFEVSDLHKKRFFEIEPFKSVLIWTN